MVFNKFWTLLNRGLTCDFGRAVSEGLYKVNDKYKELHDILVPVSDIKFSSFCTEQLLQIVLASDYKEDLLASDAVNTYYKDILSITGEYSEVIHTTDLDITTTNERTKNPTWLEKTFLININPSTMIAVVSCDNRNVKTYSFTMTNSLSDKILLKDELFLRMRGVLPSESFSIMVLYSQQFSRNITDILNSLSSIRIYWNNEDYENTYNTATFPITKLSAAVMNLYSLLSI